MAAENDITVVRTSSRSTTTRFSRESSLGKPARVDVVFDHRLQRPVSVTLSAPDGLRASDMVRLPWASWFTDADWAQGSQPGPFEIIEVSLEEFGISFPSNESFGTRPRPPKQRPGRQGHPDEHYQQVAERYTELVSLKVRNPTDRLGNEYGVSRHTAAGWVRRARELNHLPAARQGRAG